MEGREIAIQQLGELRKRREAGYAKQAINLLLGNRDRKIYRQNVGICSGVIALRLKKESSIRFAKILYCWKQRRVDQSKINTVQAKHKGKALWIIMDKHSQLKKSRLKIHTKT
jgi:hypothetical protein